MTDLRADFTQTAFNKSLNQNINAQGTVYLKKGGKLRWEYTQPTAQEIVSDGKKLWVYTPSQRGFVITSTVACAAEDVVSAGNTGDADLVVLHQDHRTCSEWALPPSPA